MTAPQTDAPTLQERLRWMVPSGRPFTGLERFEADQTAKEAADALDARDAVIAGLVEALCYMVNHAGQLESIDGIYWEATKIARAALAKAAAMK